MCWHHSLFCSNFTAYGSFPHGLFVIQMSLTAFIYVVITATTTHQHSISGINNIKHFYTKSQKCPLLHSFWQANIPLIPASVKAVIISLFHVKHRYYLQFFMVAEMTPFHTSLLFVVCINKEDHILIKYLYIYWLKEYTARKLLKELRDLRPFGPWPPVQSLQPRSSPNEVYYVGSSR